MINYKAKPMKQFKPRILLSIFVLVATFFSLIYYITFTVSKASTNVSAATSAWNPIFTDEFDGPLDSSKWRNHYDGSGQDCENGRSNGERQAYMASNSYTENGKLLLKAENKSNCGVPYTSGSVSTLGKFDYQYGYAEASIKSTKGKGMWPAFWLVPSKVGTWPPEIDILEQVDVNKEENVMTTHYNDASGKETGNTGYYKPGSSLADSYHTYGTLWLPDKLVWFIDGVERFRDTNPAHIAQQKLFIILNLAVGGNWPGYPDANTPFPGYLSTDWVRVYQGGDESSVSQVLNGARPNSNTANSSNSTTSAMVSQSSISKSSQNSAINSISNDCSVATNKVVKILLLGDSITAETFENGYRGKEWIKLTNSGYKNKIDFVGSTPRDDTQGVDKDSTSYGWFRYQDFYVNGGQGTYAWNDDGFKGFVNEINTHNPDIIQILAGTDNGGTPENDKLYLNKMIDDARAKNPKIKFVVGRADRYGKGPGTKGDFVLDQTAAAKSTSESSITIVDAYPSNFNQAAGADTLDGTHNNAAGADKMSTAFADAMKPVIDSVLTDGSNSQSSSAGSVSSPSAQTSSNASKSSSPTINSNSSVSNSVSSMSSEATSISSSSASMMMSSSSSSKIQSLAMNSTNSKSSSATSSEVSHSTGSDLPPVSSSSSQATSIMMSSSLNSQVSSSRVSVSNSNSSSMNSSSSSVIQNPISDKSDSNLVKTINGKIDLVSSINTPVIKVGDSIKLTFTGLKSKDGSPLANFKVRVLIQSPNGKVIKLLTTTDSQGNIELDLTPPKLSWFDVAAYASSYTVESGDMADLNSQTGNYTVMVQTIDSRVSSNPVTWKVESTPVINVVGILARTGGFSFVAPILLLLSLSFIYYIYSKKPKFLNFKRK